MLGTCHFEYRLNIRNFHRGLNEWNILSSDLLLISEFACLPAIYLDKIVYDYVAICLNLIITFVTG